MPRLGMCCRGYCGGLRAFAQRLVDKFEAGWVAAYDFDRSEPSSPQRLPTRAT